jgi:hypothetical protein
MKYERDYRATPDCPRETQDVIALVDLRAFLGAERFRKLVLMYDVPVERRASSWADPEVFNQLSMSMNFAAGVTGYPVAAFARKYILASYLAYMGDLVDAEGFPREDEGASS